MNKVIMMGRLTRDPEVRYSQNANSSAIANFSIAVNRRFKREGEPDADFFNCTAFGKQAEFVEKYLRKGIKIVISGRLQNNDYTNKDGQQVYGVKIMIEEIEFAESKGASENAGNGNTRNGNFSNNSNAGNNGYGGYNNSNCDNGFMNIPDGIDEELPFN